MSRRQANLRKKLLLIQVCLELPWAVKQMAERVGWRPQLLGEGIDEQIAAAQAMFEFKDVFDPMRKWAAGGVKELENSPRGIRHRCEALSRRRDLHLSRLGARVKECLLPRGFPIREIRIYVRLRVDG
jgi:hypothetical protein